MTCIYVHLYVQNVFVDSGFAPLRSFYGLVKEELYSRRSFVRCFYYSNLHFVASFKFVWDDNDVWEVCDKNSETN